MQTNVRKFTDNYSGTNEPSFREIHRITAHVPGRDNRVIGL